MSLEKAGTIMYWALCGTTGWDADDKLYKFQAPAARSEDGIRIDAQKHPDKTFRVWVFGDKGVLTHFRVPMPALEKSPDGVMGVHVAVTWDKGEVKLFLNSQLVETRQVPAGR